MADEPSKPDGIPFAGKIEFRTASPNVYQAAEDLLKAHLLCPEPLKKIIRKVAKALIDETEEMQRETEVMRANKPDSTVQLNTISPPETVELARALLETVLSNKTHQEKVRLIAKCYAGAAEFNRNTANEFRRNLGLDPLPPDAGN